MNSSINKYNSKISNSFILKITPWVIIGIIVLRDIIGIGISSFTITILLLIAFLFLDAIKLTYLLCFIFPFLTGISSGRVMLLATILLIIKRKSVRFSQIFMISFVLGMELIASRWYLYSNFSEMLPYFSCSSILFLLILDNSQLNYRQCIKFYFYGVIGAIMISILGSVTSGGLTVANLVSSRGHIGTTLESIDGAKISFNANTYAYYCISGVTCGFVLIKTEAKKILRYRFIVLDVLLAMAGIISVSRTFLIVIALCTFLYVLSEEREIKKIIKLGALILIVTIAVFYILKSNAAIINAWVGRFQGEDIETGGQRVTLLHEYMKVFLANERFKWLGTGVTQYRAVTNIYNSIHNALQQILVCLGIPGFIIYITALISPIWKMRKVKIKLLYWIPLIGIVVFLQSVQFLNPSMFIPTYAIGIFALKYGGNDK